MGTRSLTMIGGKGEKAILTMYRQYDGYPEGHGLDLAEYLAPFAITNGIGAHAKLGLSANGVGCLSAQLVKHFKEAVGNIYLYPEGTHDIGEEYIYKVCVEEGNTTFVKGGNITIEVYEIGWGDDPDEAIFKGTPHHCAEWCKTRQQ